MTMLANPPSITTSRRPSAHRSATARAPGALDVSVAVRRFWRMSSLLSRTSLLYDVATRSDEALLVSLARAGAGFAVDEPGVAGACAVGVAPAPELLSTALLSSCDVVAGLAEHGCDTFVVRSPEETCRVAIAAPGSSVLVRVVPLSASGEAGPDVGCTVAEAVTVLRQAAASGLEARGVSFEIASVRRSPRAWAAAVGAAARLFGAAAEAGLRLDTVDLGGGLPAMEDGAPPLASYAATLERALHQEFGQARPRTMVRVGRAVVGAAAAAA